MSTTAIELRRIAGELDEMHDDTADMEPVDAINQARQAALLHAYRHTASRLRARAADFEEGR
jgi:hypothetical protein